jgi:tetratricopeptide (TPR) repeat protein
MRQYALGRDVRQMRRDAARALQMLSPGSQWRPTAASILGTAELLQGNLDTADKHLAETVELAADLGAPPAASLALANRAIIAIRRDRWHQAQALTDRSSSVIQQAHLQDYASTALAYAVSSRAAAHRGDPWTAREEISAASRVLPLLTRALALLAVETRLELVRAYLALGDVAEAEDLLSEADQLLRGGCDFGSLHDDASELSATLEQIHTGLLGQTVVPPWAAHMRRLEEGYCRPGPDRRPPGRGRHRPDRPRHARAAGGRRQHTPGSRRRPAPLRRCGGNALCVLPLPYRVRLAPL